MTGRELLKILEDLPEEQLNIPLYVYADHGQSTMQANGVEIGYTTAYEYDLEDVEVSGESMGDYEEGELLPFICVFN
jgi:hypothetical protein